MSVEVETRVNHRGEPRVPFNGAVRLRYRLFQRFLEENAANISSGGMFIRTIHPGEIGSELDFEVRLEDGFTLIEGRGEVIWVRRPDEQSDAQPGMGIRFVDLEGESRALVDKIVHERVKAGLELFDLEGQVAEAEATSGIAPDIATLAEDDPIWDLGTATTPSQVAPGDEPAVAERIVEPAQAGNPVRLDPEVPRRSSLPGSSPAGGSPAVQPVRGAAGRRSSPLRWIAVAMVSALLGAGVVLAFYWFYVQPSIDALEMRIDELTGSPGGPWRPPEEEPGTAAAAVDEAAAEEAVPAPGSEAGQIAAVVDALRGWAQAWTEQRTEDYLACYDSSFEPPGGLDRATWESDRRARIERPEWIRVALTLVRVEPTGPAAAEVHFVQSYRSERYEDLVRKQLSMVDTDGGWKIAAERALSQ